MTMTMMMKCQISLRTSHKRETHAKHTLKPQLLIFNVALVSSTRDLAMPRKIIKKITQF